MLRYWKNHLIGISARGAAQERMRFKNSTAAYRKKDRINHHNPKKAFPDDLDLLAILISIRNSNLMEKVRHEKSPTSYLWRH